MKICQLISIAAVALSCSTNKTNEAETNDSTRVKDSAESLAPVDDSFGSSIDSYLVNAAVDSSAYQQITTTCAIVMEETEEQAKEREQRENEKYLADKEVARKAWENEQHDSTETFEYAPGYEGDGDFYFNQAKEILSQLNVPLITAKPKAYVRLVANGRKTLLVDIRSNMIPQWTIILFHVKKEPMVVEATDVSKERIKRYFQLP